MDSEKVFDDIISSGRTDDMVELDASISKSLPGLELLSLPQYDMLPGEDLPKKEGEMMLSGYEGVREKSGDEIKFSASYTAKEDSNIDKKGDKYSEKGSLNTKTNTLILWNRTAVNIIMLQNLLDVEHLIICNIKACVAYAKIGAAA